ncbi:glycosyltransferase family 2 protein [Frigoribacterium sp. PhB116]|uniref:glycosyltransferase family 2 protein n=1 Tax=Frigoribacterium sp. PhB116 TaxID=2485174 RepID=UPI00105BF045|nr:glycosyltransferase family 2 protein [Frigoribacterium sp. PhB116]TDT66068.1 N-acetylglucosaminyl-diphospho-decaprenol L-rhamnosyltransferase [Frigoribacterium sp. PhB116]
MTGAPKVAVVTVSYNSGRYLAEFLQSAHQASEQPAPVVVADNGSLDAEGLRATTERHGARFVSTGRNAGYGAAVNRAVQELRGDVDWILVSNPDVVLSPGSVDRLLSTATSRDDVGAVGPAIVETDGSLYPSARRVPSLRTGLGHALFANVWPRNPWTRLYHADDRPAGLRDVGWLSGACLLVRAELFHELGGFDERYFMYFEDVDLGWRIGRRGFVNVYDPAARVVHVGAHSTVDSSDAMRLAHHRSAYRFLAGKYPGWYLWPLRAVLRTALSVRAHAGPRRRPRPGPSDPLEESRPSR